LQSTFLGTNNATPYQNACRVRAGAITYLGSLGGRYGSAAATNDSNEAVGTSEWKPMRDVRATLWLASGAPQQLAPGYLSNDLAHSAVAINNQREIVGSGSRGVFLWRNGRLGLLSELLDQPLVLSGVLRINNKGQILATTGGSTPQVVLLTPTP